MLTLNIISINIYDHTEDHLGDLEECDRHRDIFVDFYMQSLKFEK